MASGYTYGQLTVPVSGDTRQLASDVKSGAVAAGQQAASGISNSMTTGLRAAGGLGLAVGKSVAVGLSGATVAAAGFGVEAFKTAARVGEMDASLRALAKANGLNYDEMQKAVSAIRKQGIEAGTAQTLVAQFARNNLDLAKSTDLARVAQDAAVISGRNSTEVLDDLVHGITTQNSMVLRNAGIQVQAGQAVDAYAKSVGKSTKELTDAERAQAVLNAVLESGKTVAGAYAEAMNEPGKVLRSFPRVIDDIKLSVGQGLVKALGPAILGLYDLAKALSAAVAPGGALEPIFAAIGVAVGKLVQPVTAMIATWAKWIENLKPEQVDKITEAVKRFGPAIIAGAGAITLLTGGAVAGKIPILGGMLTNLTGPITMVGKGLVTMGGSALAAVPGLGSMGTAAGLLPAAMNPVGAVIVGVVAAIAALMVSSKDFREGIIAMGSALWTGLQPALSSVWNLLKTFGLALWEIVKAIGDALGPALKNLSPLLEQIGKLFGTNLAGGADGASGSLGAIVPVITGVIKVIGFLLDITTKVLVPIIEVPLKMAVWASVMTQTLNPLKLVGQAIEWLTGVVTKLWHWITGNSPGLIPAFQLLGQVVGQVAGGVLSVAGQKFGQLAGIVSSAFNTVTGITNSAWSGMVSSATSAGASMVSGLKSGLSSAMSGIGGWIGNNITGPVMGAVKSGFGISSPSKLMLEVGLNLGDALKRGWADPSAWKSMATQALSAGADLIAGLKAGLGDSLGDITSWVKSNIAGPIMGGLKSAFGIGSPSRLTWAVGENLGDSLLGGWADSLAGGITAPGISGSPLGGSAPGLAGVGGGGATINVYPQAGQDERQIAALVSRELAWASAGGIR